MTDKVKYYIVMLDDEVRHRKEEPLTQREIQAFCFSMSARFRDITSSGIYQFYHFYRDKGVSEGTPKGYGHGV